MESPRLQKTHQVLKKAFLAKQKRNPLYSQRALARDLGTSPVFVTKILTGKKSVPPSRFKKLFKILDMDITLQTELMRAALLEAVPSSDLRSFVRLSLDKDPAMSKLQREEKGRFHILRQWYNIAILNYITCDLDDSVTAIAKYFSLAESDVVQSLRGLAEAKLIRVEDGKWVKIDKRTYFPTTTSKEEVREYHRQMISKAQMELTKTTDEDFQRRLITGFTIAASPEKIEVAKKMIADYAAEVAEVLAEDSCSEVYQLNVQLFPLGKVK